MANWREIGIDNYKAAEALHHTEHRYRSAASRYYYAVFSLLTEELYRRGAVRSFNRGQATPSHAQLPALVDTWFVHMSEARRRNLMNALIELYRLRVLADYSPQRVDRITANGCLRLADRVFRYLGVGHE